MSSVDVEVILGNSSDSSDSFNTDDSHCPCIYLLEVKFRYTRQVAEGQYRVYYIIHKFTQTTSILIHDYFQRNTFGFTTLQNRMSYQRELHYHFSNHGLNGLRRFRFLLRRLNFTSINFLTHLLSKMRTEFDYKWIPIPISQVAALGN